MLADVLAFLLGGRAGLGWLTLSVRIERENMGLAVIKIVYPRPLTPLRSSTTSPLSTSCLGRGFISVDRINRESAPTKPE